MGRGRGAAARPSTSSGRGGACGAMDSRRRPQAELVEAWAAGLVRRPVLRQARDEVELVVRWTPDDDLRLSLSKHGRQGWCDGPSFDRSYGERRGCSTIVVVQNR